MKNLLVIFILGFLGTSFSTLSAQDLPVKMPSLDTNIFAKDIPWERLANVVVLNADSTVHDYLSFDSTAVDGDNIVGHMGDNQIPVVKTKKGRNTILSLQRESSYELIFSTKALPGLGEKDSVTVQGIWKTRLSENPVFITFRADSLAQSKGEALLDDAGDVAVDAFNGTKDLVVGLSKLAGVTKTATNVFDWDEGNAFILTASGAESLNVPIEYVAKDTIGERAIVTYATSDQYLVIHAERSGDDLNMWCAFTEKTEEAVEEMDEFLLGLETPMMVTSAKNHRKLRKRGGVVDLTIVEIPERLRAGLSLGEVQALGAKLSFGN